MAALDPTTAVTNQLTPTGDVNMQPTIDDIARVSNGLQSSMDQRYNYQLAPNPYQQQLQAQSDRYAGAIPQLPADILYPSNQDINKGSYQGSIVGNVPIYAPSHLVPFGVFDAKQQALQAAALAKQKDAADFYTAYKTPITKRSAVQGELNDTYTEGLQKWIDNAQKQYGKDWATYLKQDQGFNNWNQSMQTVAQYEDQVVDKVASLQKDLSSGRDMAPETIKAMSDFMQGIGGLDNPYNLKSQNLGQTIMSLYTLDNYETTIDDAVKNVKQQIIDSNPSISSQGIYDKIQWYTTTQTGDEALKDMASSLWKTQYGGSSFITPDMVYRDLKARLPKSTEVHVQEQNNQFAGASGADQVYDVNSVIPEGVPVTYKGAENGVTTYDGQTFDPTPLNVPNQQNAIDPATGERINIPANSNIAVGKAFNILVTNDGAPVNGNTVPAGQDPNNYHYETYVAGTVKGGSQTTTNRKTSTTTPIEQTVWMPAKGVQNGLMTVNSDGSYKKGVRIDVMSTNALARTNQLRSSATTTNTESSATLGPKGQSFILPSGKTAVWNGTEYVAQ